MIYLEISIFNQLPCLGVLANYLLILK